jgi:hypothetical protein
MGLPGRIKEHPNLHVTPERDSAVIGVLQPGAVVDVIQQEGDYFRIVIEGYVHTSLLEPAVGAEPGLVEQPAQPASVSVAGPPPVPQPPVAATVEDGLAPPPDRLLRGAR